MSGSIRNNAMRCPHCDAPAPARTARVVTRLVSERHHQCSDLECGHTFVAQLLIVRTIRPSGKPRTSVLIPFGAARVPPPGLPRPANDPEPTALEA